jgi:hypothetical protein
MDAVWKDPLEQALGSCQAHQRILLCEVVLEGERCRKQSLCKCVRTRSRDRAIFGLAVTSHFSDKGPEVEFIMLIFR